MEKRVWTKPLAAVEQFVANEYIAKCDDLVNKYYQFVCDGGDGVRGGVWEETNGVAGLQSSSSGSLWGGSYVAADKRWSSSSSSYHACGASHYAPVDSTDFIYNCYYKAYGQDDSTAISVILWRGENNDNVHVTTNMNVDTEIVQGNKS